MDMDIVHPLSPPLCGFSVFCPPLCYKGQATQWACNPYYYYFLKSYDFLFFIPCETHAAYVATKPLLFASLPEFSLPFPNLLCSLQYDRVISISNNMHIVLHDNIIPQTSCHHRSIYRHINIILVYPLLMLSTNNEPKFFLPRCSCCWFWLWYIWSTSVSMFCMIFVLCFF